MEQKTLNISALINEISKIRDMLDKVEVKGHDNRTYLVVAYQNCSDIIKQLSDIEEETRKRIESEGNEQDLHIVSVEPAE